ncbi:MAG: glycosyltransferase family 39 protein, partial [Candidatus Aenigmatarchaeota archaeon]
MKVRRDLLPVMAILAAGMLYYYVSLQSHIVFGDEGYYSSVGRWMADNAVMPVYEPYYHTDIYHPKFVKHPLHFFFNVGAWLLLGELGIKLLIPVFSVLTALLLYAFLKREGAPWLGAASALIFLMLPGVVTYGVLDYVETLNFMLITLALVFGYYTVNGRGLAHTLLAGVFLGLALLTDITALFAALVLLCYFVFSRRFGSWRNVLLVIVLAGIMVSPFLIRNMMLFGSPCYAFLSGGECAPKIDMEIAHSPYLGGTFVSGEAAVGTGAGLLKMGVLNYMRFAFGWSASVILLFGIAFAAAKRDKFSLLMVAWFVAFLLLNVHQALYGGRSEDLQRYSLFGFPAVALLCGLFVTESCRWSARKHKILAGILVLVFAVAFFNYGYEKITTMASVKAFAPGFFV